MRPRELPNSGPERYTTRRVVFARPFTLGKAPEVYPAGVYQVETREQPLDAGGHTAHVRTSTILIVPTASGTYSREVRGSELDEAVLRDSQHSGSGEPSENPDRGNANGGTPEVLP
jgi:hypothetical protein